MDLVKLCLSPLCSCMQSPVVRQDMSHVFSTKEKIDDLKNAMEQLLAKRNDIQRELDDPQNKGKLLRDELQLWLRNVGEKENKVERLLDEYHKSNCVAGSCSLNCFSRYKISIDANKLKEEINQLTTKQPEIKFTDIPPPKPVPESYRTVGKKISSNLDMARSYLADEAVGMIGIWGMGGVGKTTLLKKINKSLLDDANMGFNHVLFIEASKDIQLEELRKQITESLQLQGAGKNDTLNVLKISNFVLLLDNIWEEVDLIDLGIPHPYSDDNSTKQYKHKVIFTTRSEDVCAKMGAGENTIKVECLQSDEAWDLFKDNVNLAVIESDEKFKEIAWQVMEKCGGLPLALKVVGKAMSNKKTVQNWVVVLNKLEQSDTQVVQGVQESLFPFLKLSYDNLTDYFKQCFLSICMLRGQHKHNILEFLMGLGLIRDFDNFQEAYGTGENILKVLEESCLLSSDDDVVSLHDVIYEMAVWIASDSGRNMNKWIVKTYDWFPVELPAINTENWRFAKRVIISGKVELLPILSHQCSDLLCLMIQFNSWFKNIPEGFFRQMPNLTYLDLQNTGIEELPKGIKCLVNLQSLNISSTNISSLPKELVHLMKLQYLICGYLNGLGKVEENLMSRLQNLKIMDVFPSGWVDLKELKKLKIHVKAIGMRVVSKEVLQQLSCFPTMRLCLYNLDIISLSFDTLSCKNHGFLQELRIESCPQLKELVMDGSRSHLNYLSILNVKKLQNIFWKDLSPREFFHVLKMLLISRCNLDNLAWVLHLPCLSWLEIKDCAEIETLFYIEEEREIQQQEVSEHRPTFPALKFLIIKKLPKLVSISNFALDFPQLSLLHVGECLNLKKLPFKSGINNNQRIIDIDCEREWWESLEWDDATIPSHLRPRLLLG
ncbi:putative disease resistance protein At4g10780 [Dioscorea cayenensis subsp. rotundata]|uniref:Disease resistance protein At4g10780 n=1 Tax=Dioscorea cayennensis subsp. rotundata TaxID=55577 RepID=A0AB40B0Z0_DIOCR|nr:putative disease resistance protein At4g10780 [Dioscorea cayenensis subsp. rotundata]XP_039120389.1 putative disease resistance protein At4g10780 [Dioscorea cayenensis subsp. rotundata]